MNTRIYPVILAAGNSQALGFPKALARFGARTALEIALDNVAALAPAVVVLGEDAAEVRRAVRRPAKWMVNAQWRKGQMSSLLSGMAAVPGNAHVMLYPVDYPLLTPALVTRLVEGFLARADAQQIAMPCFRGRAGHPVIFAASLRGELQRAATAREVVYRDPARIKKVAARTPAIWQDMDSPAAYRARLRTFHQRGVRASVARSAP